MGKNYSRAYEFYVVTGYKECKNKSNKLIIKKFLVINNVSYNSSKEYNPLRTCYYKLKEEKTKKCIGYHLFEYENVDTYIRKGISNPFFDDYIANGNGHPIAKPYKDFIYDKLPIGSVIINESSAPIEFNQRKYLKVEESDGLTYNLNDFMFNLDSVLVVKSDLSKQEIAKIIDNIDNLANMVVNKDNKEINEEVQDPFLNQILMTKKAFVESKKTREDVDKYMYILEQLSVSYYKDISKVGSRKKFSIINKYIKVLVDIEMSFFELRDEITYDELDILKKQLIAK